MDNWYYKLFGDEFGPVTFDALVELAKSHTLSSDDEVRFGESGPWRRAGSMGQLMTHMPSGAHLPSSTGAVSSLRDSASSIPAITESTAPTGWYYQIFGEEFGPLTFEDLVDLAKNHTLSVDDQVRFGEGGAWRRAGSIGQLMAHLPFQAGKNAFSIEVKQSTSGKRKIGSNGQIDILDSDEPLPEPTNAESDSRPTIPLSTPNPPAAPTKTPVPVDVWWCMIGGKEYGPVDLPKLVAWAASGRLHRNDFVRHGLESYVVAGELPGFFPELPPSATVETKAEFTTKSVTRSMPTSNPVVEARPVPTPAEAPTSDQVPAPAANHPANSWQANAGAAGASRPTVPVRRPPPKKGSGDMGKMLVPILGVVGAVLLVGLLYLAIPYLPLGDSADGKAFKALRAAYNEVQMSRNGENVKKEEIQAAAEKMASAAKKVEGTLKGKTGAGTVKVRSLAKKLQELAKDDLTKPSDAEKSTIKTIEGLAKFLKVK